MEHRGPRVARSRNSRRRAAVLVGVHVVFAIHIAQWLLTGMTLSPIEPSESMYTLSAGRLNAGFVFFALAILSTVVFGRFLCGWGCHIVALQDLCAHWMRRLGVHPRPFRTRWLLLAPVALAIYMFVWPVFHQWVLTPALGAAGLGVPAWLGRSGPWPGLEPHFVVEDFWATFPAWYVAIPFLLVCGFATVYFLGAKGFCTYGCPYGGFFAPADRLAIGRIVVSDACEHCGHCTAVCTSNVRVHEEVRDFGMVVDPGCMKCLDCVSVCPNGALRWSIARPSILAVPRSLEGAARAAARRRNPKRYDLLRGEEVVFGALGFALFFGFRGWLNEVPMLMAMGLAGIGTFGAWKLWSLARRPSVRVQSVQLKLKGRLTRAGAVFIGGAVLLLGAGGWGIAGNWCLWTGGLLDDRVVVPLATVMAPGYTPAPPDDARAARAMARYRAAGPWGEGGVGWAHTPKVNVRLAWLSLVRGNPAEAERYLTRSFEQEPPSEDLLVQMARVIQLRGGGPAEIEAMLRGVVRRHPHNAPAHLAIGAALAARGRAEEAVRHVEAALARSRDPHEHVRAAQVLAAAGLVERALEVVDRAAGLGARGGGVHYVRASILLVLGRPEDAAGAMGRAVELEPGNPVFLRAMAELMRSLGRKDEAIRYDARADGGGGQPPDDPAGAGRSGVEGG